MASSLWPLSGLRLRTPDLELRWPSSADLEALAARAAEGIHHPERQPFRSPWTDAAPSERALGTMRYQWAQWGAWQPSDWTLALVAVHDGTVAGTQEMAGREFATLREVSTGSWLGQDFQGRGLGTQMRAAVLHLAFAGLGAEYAVSAAFADNAASQGVSRKLGYTPDGVERVVVRGRPALLRRLRLSRADWEATHAVPVEIEGLAPCLPHFGLPAGD